MVATTEGIHRTTFTVLHLPIESTFPRNKLESVETKSIEVLAMDLKSHARDLQVTSVRSVPLVTEAPHTTLLSSRV